MAYIVTDEYFIRELSIPNNNEVRDVSGGQDTFEMWIDKESRGLLKYALGYSNFNDLDGYIDVDGNLSVTAPIKWQNLVNGVEYTNDGITYNWQGLIYSEGAFKSSLLASYVYCKWLEFKVSQITGIGEVKGDSVNSNAYNSTQRLTSIWNDFIQVYQGAYCVEPKVVYNGNVKFTDYYFNQGSYNYVSLIKFLEDNSSDYVDCNLGVFDVKNSWGL